MINAKNQRWIRYHKKMGATFLIRIYPAGASCEMHTKYNDCYFASAKTINKAISHCADNFVNNLRTKDWWQLKRNQIE